MVLNVQPFGSLSVQRKVRSDADEYIRFLNIVTNNGGAPATVNLIASNNLGSDNATVVAATDDG